MKEQNIFIAASDSEFILRTCEKIIKNKKINICGFTVSAYSDVINKRINCNQIIEKDLYNDKLSKLNLAYNNQELDQSFILEINKEFEVYARTFDRIQPIPLAVNEIKKIYYTQIKFFKNYFDYYKIDHIFFINTPHFPHSLAIYIVCKILNIKTIIQQRSDINSLHFLREDLYNFKDKIIINSNKINIKRYINNYFKDTQTQKTYAMVGKEINLEIIRNFISLPRKILAFIKVLVLIIKIDVYYKLINKNSFDINFSAVWGNYSKSKFKIAFIKFKRFFQTLSLYNYLESISVKPQLNKKFVIFALQFQPEKTTLPEAGLFDNQFLAIQILSKHLPNNFQIYVKEHPRQFNLHPQLKNLHFRSKNYYKEISNLKNVEFISTFTDISKIIHKASFVSTVAGSLGVEGIKKNIPCIIFTHTWYAEHPLANLVFKSEDLINILNKKNDKNIDDKDEFIDNLSNYLFESSDGKFNLNKDSIENLSDNLSSVLIKIILGDYQFKNK